MTTARVRQQRVHLQILVCRERQHACQTDHGLESKYVHKPECVSKTERVRALKYPREAT